MADSKTPLPSTNETSTELEIPEAKRLSFSENDNKPSFHELVKVYLRIRPDHQDEGQATTAPFKAEQDAIQELDETTVQTVPPEDSQAFKNRELGAKYTFTKIFNKPSQQEEIFETTTLPLVKEVVSQGKDCLLFAYGVTNAGKTYTVEGTNENPGIIPRTLKKVFSMLDDLKSKKHVEISYLQVYNEEVHDLQVAGRPHNTKKKLQLKLREDNVEVEGLRRTRISNCAGGLEILRKGREQRTTHETVLNVSSSRSHSVFIINVIDEEISHRSSRLYIVDLAGTERGKRTQTTRARQREASNINCSLMNLMRCLDTIRHNQKQKNLNKGTKLVPFRQSKLTMLFRDCFIGGNSGGVVMVVNASARAVDYDETAHALKYGALVKHVGVVTSRVYSRKSSIQYGYDGRRIGDNDSRRGSLFNTPRNTLILENSPAPETPDDMQKLNQMSWHDLRQALFEARARCVTMEAEIREEVAREMAERLAQMENIFRCRIEAVKQISDSKSESMLGNLKKRMKGGNNLYTMKDIEELVQNILECEEEMERMRALHAMDVDILKKEIRVLKQKQQTNDIIEGDKSASEKKQLMTSDTTISKGREDEISLLYKGSPLNVSGGLNFDHVTQLEILQDELQEERDLHEKTNNQLIEATQLAQSAMDGENEARRELKEAKQEVERLKQKILEFENRNRPSAPPLPKRPSYGKRKSGSPNPGAGSNVKKIRNSDILKAQEEGNFRMLEKVEKKTASENTSIKSNQSFISHNAQPKRKNQGGLLSRMVGRLVTHNTKKRPDSPVQLSNTPIARRTRSARSSK